jgi:5-methylcytosine-specific restriction endonuclease McrA
MMIAALLIVLYARFQKSAKPKLIPEHGNQNRAHQLQRDQERQNCGTRRTITFAKNGRTGFAKVVKKKENRGHHHHLYKRSTHPELISEPTNLMYLCPDCHAIAHDQSVFKKFYIENRHEIYARIQAKKEKVIK